MPNLIKFSKYCIALSILITVVGLIAFFTKGVVMDIDFKGGNIIEVNIGKQFNNNDVVAEVKKAIGVEAVAQKLGTKQDKVSIKTAPLTQEQVTAAFNALKTKYALKDADLLSSRTVEPIIGKEIWQKGLTAMLISSVLILIYMAVRFRAMAGLSAGTTAVIAVLHDAFIMFAVYSILQIPINSSFIAAVLTILGYSVHDTIIVFDRIRENQGLLRKTSPEEIANKSIYQTLTRSINTVITVLICVIILYIYGYVNGLQSIKEFTLPLMVGLVAGAYSSIFIASPLWVMWQNATAKGSTKKKGAKPKTA